MDEMPKITWDAEAGQWKAEYPGGEIVWSDSKFELEVFLDQYAPAQ